MEGMKYKSGSLHLDPGDEIFLYTDGVTEATNGENELYGEERLKGFINGCNAASSETLCKWIKTDVDSFVGSAPQFDDITMLSFRYKGPKKA